MFHILLNFASQLTRITQNVISRHYSDYDPLSFGPIIPLHTVKRFVADFFCSLDTTEEKSETVTDAMIFADYRGHSDEGLSRLEKYLNDIRDNICDVKTEPTVEEEFMSVGVVNGNNGLGPVIGKFCMELAMEKALGTGMGLIAARGSNYYGMPSLYTTQAAEKGFIGLSFSNGVLQMVPPGGIDVALGVNPFSLAAPAHCDSLVIDMPTSATNFSTIKEFAKRKIQLPKGWALNKRGEVEQDPEMALIFKKLCPFGAEQSMKGFGLALLVEVLSGLLSDSSVGPKISVPNDKCKEPPNLGHGFIAINPEKFVPNFATRLSKLLNKLRSMDSMDPMKPILIPGDRERLHMRRIDNEGGIRYSKEQMDILEKLAKKYGVRSLEIVDFQIKHSGK